MKLGTLLLRNAAIGLSQLESALRNQVLYGGRLGTNLVELGYIDLELLSTYLAEMSGFPIATPSLLDDADQMLVDKLGADDAHRLRAVPLGYIGVLNDTAAVAFVDPTDAGAIEELEAKLTVQITPYVVPELRALYYLEKIFGLPRRARFIRAGKAEPGETISVNSDDRRREQPAKGMVIPPSFTLQPRARRMSQAPLTMPVPTATTFVATCERIDGAQNREQIADAFVSYAKGRCDAMVVLLIRDGNALGWRGYVAPPTIPKTPFEELSLPLGGASSLQAAHDAGQVFVGPPAVAAHPVESALWTALAVKPEPLSLIVLPILVKQRVVNLIYAHHLILPPAQSFVDELLDLAERAQVSYLRLIRLARGT